MPEVKRSDRGVDYIAPAILSQKKTVVARALLYQVTHDHPRRDMYLKLGRYEKPKDCDFEIPVSQKPKSELTLTDDELAELIAYLSENYSPISIGEKNYIPLDGPVADKLVAQIKILVGRSDVSEIVQIIVRENLLPEGVMAGLEAQRRSAAIDEFETMLETRSSEPDWQRWFTQNDWVLGSDCVRILDDRRIDVSNIGDYVVEGYDGFLDIIEIKKPDPALRFWYTEKDHDNHIPSRSLVAAITQCQQYLFELEREMDSAKFVERMGIRVVKPRAVLIYGRSADWADEERESFRILNRSYHSLTILTYDHVLARAKRLLVPVNKREPANC